MLGIDWANLTTAGAFVAGLGIGVLITVRIAKVLAQFLVDLRRKGED